MSCLALWAILISPPPDRWSRLNIWCLSLSLTLIYVYQLRVVQVLRLTRRLSYTPMPRPESRFFYQFASFMSCEATCRSCAACIGFHSFRVLHYSYWCNDIIIPVVVCNWLTCACMVDGICSWWVLQRMQQQLLLKRHRRKLRNLREQVVHLLMTEGSTATYKLVLTTCARCERLLHILFSSLNQVFSKFTDLFFQQRAPCWHTPHHCLNTAFLCKIGVPFLKARPWGSVFVITEILVLYISVVVNGFINDFSSPNNGFTVTILTDTCLVMQHQLVTSFLVSVRNV